MGIERLDLVTGGNCNNNCIFCVLGDEQKRIRQKTKQEIIKDMKKHAKYCKFLTLTGGEPTIRKDVFELIRTAKKLGYTDIHLQTNGRMLSYDNFCKKIIKAGVTSFTVSFQAHNSELGDMVSKTKNSFSQTVKGIKNVKKYGAKVITNTVLSKLNYMYLAEIVKKAIELGSDQVQMVFVRPQGQVLKRFENLVPKMSEVILHIYRAIDFCKSQKKIVLVEGIPLCLMQGYEECIAEEHMPITKIIAMEDFYMRKKTKIKDKKCSACKLNNRCTGVWTNYAKRYGFGEFKPI